MSLEKVDVEKYYPYKDKLDLGIFLEKRIVNLDLLENKLDFIIYEKERIIIETGYEDNLNVRRILTLIDLIRDDLKNLEEEFNIDKDRIFKTYELDINNQLIELIIEIKEAFYKHYKIKVSFEDDGKVIIEKEI